MPEKVKLPRLEELFFAVCNTAIENCSWPYKDMPRIEFVKGQLASLHDFVFGLYEQEAAIREQANVSAPVASPEAIVEPQTIPEVPVTATTEPIPSTPENGADANPVTATPPVAPIVTPEEAAKAPVRPMPTDIADLVEIGVEVAKNPPKVRDVKVDEIPTDPDAARKAWDKPF